MALPSRHSCSRARALSTIASSANGCHDHREFFDHLDRFDYLPWTRFSHSWLVVGIGELGGGFLVTILEDLRHRTLQNDPPESVSLHSADDQETRAFVVGGSPLNPLGLPPADIDAGSGFLRTDPAPCNTYKAWKP